MKLALAETSGPLRRVVEPLLLELMTPESCCHAGIAILSGLMPPPLSDPGSFRLPRACRAGGNEIGAADRNYVCVIRRPRL